MAVKDQRQTNQVEAVEEPIDIRALLHVLIEKAWLIAICVLVGLFAGLAYIAKTTKIYRSEAVIEVDPQATKERVLGMNGGPGDDLTNDEMMQTIVDGFYTRAVWLRVVQANSLEKDPDFLPPKPNGKSYTVDEAVDAMGDFVKARRRKGTRLVDVAIEHPKPAMAQKIADSLAREYIKEKISGGVGASDIAVEYLMEEANKVKEHLQKSEEALQAYKEKYNSVSLEEKQDTVISKLRNQTGLYTTAKADRIRLEADLKELEKLAGRPEEMLVVGSVAKHPVIVETKREIAETENQISVLSVRYTSKHPRMIEANTKLAQLKAALLQNAANMPQLIRADYQSALTTEKNFESALHDQEKTALELNQQSIGYNTLRRDVETDQALYEALLARIKQTDVAKGIEISYVHIFEPASITTTPFKPRIAFAIAISILGGLVGGVALSLGLDAIDSSFKTVDQVEAVTGLPVLAAIPKSDSGSETKQGVILLDQPESLIAEAFRSLRTAVSVAAKKGEGRIFVFTGAMPGEGKSFCALNYAAALAQQGLRTVLIDADLRRPKIDKLLKLKERSPGLVDYLEGKESANATVHSTAVAGLSVIPCGNDSSQPAELLSKPSFGVLLKDLAGQFERVVIDSAPLTAVSDTLLIVEHSPNVCLVVQANKTSRRMVLRACRLLADAGTKPLGIILNQIPAKGGIDSYYHYSPTNYGNEVYGMSTGKASTAKV